MDFPWNLSILFQFFKYVFEKYIYYFLVVLYGSFLSVLLAFLFVSSI